MASPLLQLPADIRNIIYDFAFYCPNGLHIDLEHSDLIPQPRDIFALSQTCKSIHQETRDLPYWLNVLHLHVPLLQDLSTLRSRSQLLSLPPSTTHHQILPAATTTYQSRRLLPINSSKSAYLTSAMPSLRHQAQEYITLALRLPHLEPLLTTLSTLTRHSSNNNNNNNNHPKTHHPLHLLHHRTRKFYLHLGTQTSNIFLERFFAAWDAISPLLSEIIKFPPPPSPPPPPSSSSSPSHAPDIRIAFTLRLSRRLVISYDFSISNGPVRALEEMDWCVNQGVWIWRCGREGFGGGEGLELLEFGAINAVRERVWRTLRGREKGSEGYQVQSPAKGD